MSWGRFGLKQRMGRKFEPGGTRPESREVAEVHEHENGRRQEEPIHVQQHDVELKLLNAAARWRLRQAPPA